MSPARSKKPASRASIASEKRSRDVITPTTPERSPIKKRKMGISLRHKQALIQNLQLEITERARRLRAQYHLQAQALRTRIEIRVNRIPTSLRTMKMGELLEKCIEQEQLKVSTGSSRPPPVPAKDIPARGASLRPGHSRTQSVRVPVTSRGQKLMSDELAGDKENEPEHETARKRARAGTAPSSAVRPNHHVLSPTTSNSRLHRDRPISPTKMIPRPGSPLKSSAASRSAVATNILSSMVAKTSSRPPTARKNTLASSTGSGTAPPGRPRKNTVGAPLSRPGTRNGRRVSVTSETSEGSTGTTVVKGRPRAATATSSTTKKVMSSFRKTTTATDTKKAVVAAPKGTAPTTTSTGRILRKRA